MNQITSRLGKLALLFVALAFTALPAMADVVELNSGGFREVTSSTHGGQAQAPIPTPGTANYTTRTTLLNPVCAGACTPPTSIVLSFQGGGFTVTPSIALQVRQVPTSWGSWSSPPFSETATPQVYFSQGATTMTLNLNQVATIGGFELEPNPFSVQTFTAQFFNGATLIETVTQSLTGQAGARLFAIDNLAGFNRIVVTGTSDFAIARVRMGTGGASAVPEPATMLLLGTGLAGIAAKVRKRRKA